LGKWYNDALVVIELTGGYGEAVMLRMRQDLHYWNLFLDESSHAQADPHMSGRFGVETNQRTKPYMVSALQRFVKDRMIDIPCRGTLSEMIAFEQERTEKNLITPRYRGTGGEADDRVMSLVIAAGVLAQPQVVDYIQQSSQTPATEHVDAVWAEVHKELEEDANQDPFD
ncbi:MAG: hypothetical protein NWE76_05690, partial [Candidatus Bathyarchaeota archaeon]|nr:hypothetical protein [Candidatus Bathyarchaeota archaeon]